MSGEEPLAGHTVLVTRPAHQAARLCELVEQAGGSAFRFPVIEIAPPADPAAARAALRQLDRYDLAVFVSANAVEQALALLAPDRLPGPPRLAAVGRATAAALHAAGYRDVVVPAARFDSEGLLETPALREVDGREVAVVRGEGGREWLSRQLRARGALVSQLEIYRRVRPSIPAGPLQHALERGVLSLLTASSGEGLENLLTLAGPKTRPDLLKLPLVVPSTRARAIALARGFHGPVLVAGSAGDEHMLEALIYAARKR